MRVIEKPLILKYILQQEASALAVNSEINLKTHANTEEDKKSQDIDTVLEAEEVISTSELNKIETQAGTKDQETQNTTEELHNGYQTHFNAQTLEGLFLNSYFHQALLTTTDHQSLQNENPGYQLSSFLDDRDILNSHNNTVMQMVMTNSREKPSLIPDTGHEVAAPPPVIEKPAPISDPFIFYDAVLRNNGELPDLGMDREIVVLYGNDVSWDSGPTRAVIENTISRYWPDINDAPDILQLDVEKFPLDIWQTPEQNLDTIEKLTFIIDTFQELLPNTDIGFFRLFPEMNYGNFTHNDAIGVEKWRDLNELLQPLAAKVDVVFPNMYVKNVYTTYETWEAHAQELLNEAVQYGKPVIPVLMPTYHPAAGIHPKTGENLSWKIMDDTLWTKILEFVHKNADGALIWGNPIDTVGDIEHWAELNASVIKSLHETVTSPQELIDIMDVLTPQAEGLEALFVNEANPATQIVTEPAENTNSDVQSHMDVSALLPDTIANVDIIL